MLEAIRYIVVGVITTILNFFFYFLCKSVGLDTNISNAIGLLISVLFAYFANKYFVFNKNFINLEEEIDMITMFFLSRLGTILFDIFGFFILNNLLSINDFFAKVIINIVVIVMNYLISKNIIFKKRGTL